jgi:hypothetical protein
MQDNTCVAEGRAEKPGGGGGDRLGGGGWRMGERRWVGRREEGDAGSAQARARRAAPRQLYSPSPAADSAPQLQPPFYTHAWLRPQARSLTFF